MTSSAPAGDERREAAVAALLDSLRDHGVAAKAMPSGAVLACV